MRVGPEVPAELCWLASLCAALSLWTEDIELASLPEASALQRQLFLAVVLFIKLSTGWWSLPERGHLGVVVYSIFRQTHTRNSQGSSSERMQTILEQEEHKKKLVKKCKKHVNMLHSPDVGTATVIKKRYLSHFFVHGRARKTQCLKSFLRRFRHCQK